MVLCSAAALLFGGTKLSPKDVFAGLLGIGEKTAVVIVRSIRLPRLLGGLAAGAGLSVSGVLLQNATDNGLASPNIIGVNSGAGLAVILVLSFFPKAVPVLPLAAFGGALAATFLIVWTANCIDSTKSSIILAGMALTTVLNACISFVSLLDTDVVAVYNYFSVGGLAGVTAEELGVPAGMIAVSLAVSLALSGKISALGLGDSVAASLGIRVKALRSVCLVCASASAAAAVSFAGLLGFVGLIVPHMVRAIVGGNVRRCLIAAPLAGGAVVTLADTLGRTVFAPTEIPVGVVMALVGSPFFLILLFRRKRRA